MRRNDIIIIGSGPAGVAAAWPLVEAGLPVTMIDAGVGVRRDMAGRPGLADMRRHGDWRSLLGPGLEGLRDIGDGSPKLRTAGAPGMSEAYASANRVSAGDGFRVVGALEAGGLSRIWGAVACAYDAADLDGWPDDVVHELPDAYRRVAARIGISGDAEDARHLGIGGGMPLLAPLPLSPSAEYLRRRAATADLSGMKVGRSVSAVLSRPCGPRNACTGCRACMWGCGEGAIYDSSFELPALSAYPNFKLVTATLVTAVQPDGQGWIVQTRSGETLTAGRIVLAAGTLASTRLALSALPQPPASVSLQNTPAFAFAAVVPARLGAALPPSGFGMAQLCLVQRAGDADAFALLYDADVVAAPDLMARMPLTRPGAATLTKLLLPGLVLGLAYLPGRFSANRAVLEGAGPDAVLTVEGGCSAAHAAVARSLRAGLAGNLRRLGAVMLPGSFGPITNGAEVHLGGSLPMGKVTDSSGQMLEVRGLHIVDGSVLPSLSAKHHTLTIMANADRIGRRIASQMGSADQAQTPSRRD